eukprot:CAMPEP_0170559822 /NCGR_PEP_ID=MMETSP0211-20121228/45252_1 /TAXON_ID=311385 /ORGANISM="Pseudokeronopsis sp., Strain OXSARD2" /LENGTH=49 /DNA_ID= /DNA_START= /DNA_END= /DNA_ORIENTATION=
MESIKPKYISDLKAVFPIYIGDLIMYFHKDGEIYDQEVFGAIMDGLAID